MIKAPIVTSAANPFGRCPLMLSKGGSSGKPNGLAALVAIGAFIIGYIALKSPVQAGIFFGIAVANYLAFQLGERTTSVLWEFLP